MSPPTLAYIARKSGWIAMGIGLGTREVTGLERHRTERAAADGGDEKGDEQWTTVTHEDRSV